MSEIFSIEGLLARVSGEHRYSEFLRVSSMSAGIYVLQPGAIDPQTPHKEDEIYYVIRGNAKMKLGSDEREVGEGDVIFVERNLEHRFFDVVEEIVLLVVFAPAESGESSNPLFEREKADSSTARNNSLRESFRFARNDIGKEVFMQR